MTVLSTLGITGVGAGVGATVGGAIGSAFFGIGALPGAAVGAAIGSAAASGAYGVARTAEALLKKAFKTFGKPRLKNAKGQEKLR